MMIKPVTRMRDGPNSASSKEHLSNCGEIVSWLYVDAVSIVKERQQGKDQQYELKLGTTWNKLQ